MTASEMGKKSAAARRKKRGGKAGVSEHMREISNKRSKRYKRYLDKGSQTTRNA
jgi:hypothetical protein